jgi:hypothetical protein
VEQPQSSSVATPAELLRTRGAPSTLYTVSGEDLVALHVEENDVVEQVIDVPDGFAIIDFDASPTGDRVGVLLAGLDGASFVQFYRADGTVIGGPFEPVASGTPGATPGASPAATPMATPDAPGAISAIAAVDAAGSATWVPQGNGLLVTWNNVLSYVDSDEGFSDIDTTGIDGTMQDAAASPKGDQILVRVVFDDGTQGAYLIDGPTGEVHALRALRTSPENGISQLQWLPSGNGVVFVEGEIVDGVVMRGQLFAYLFRNEVPRLVATPGQGGPSGTITNVAVSADGYSVAYDISIRDVDRWAVHSVWIRSLKQDVPGIQVPVSGSEPLTRLMWSSEGLVWSQEADARVYVMRPSGEVGALSGEAGPGATPDASPDASPVTTSSPVATPVGTPVPVG